MKHLLLCLAVATCGLTACSTSLIPAKGAVEERVITISEQINALDISHGFDVVVDKTLTQNEILINTHSDIYEYIDIHVEGSSLHINLKHCKLYAKTLEVRIPEYDINSIAISGGADLVWHDASLSTLALAASGGSDVEMTCTSAKLSITASGGTDIDINGNFENLAIVASGGSDVEMAGQSKQLSVAASGGTDINLGELTAEVVTITASGGADVDICATTSLTANASGGADVSYRGNPTFVNIEESGGGDVHHRN